MLAGGYAANVVPSSAIGLVDGRMLPGHEDEFWEAFRARLPPTVSYRLTNDSPAIATVPDDPELSLIAAAVQAHDPRALVLPCCAAGGTDAKWLSRLGIACFGFAPERMAPGFPIGRYVHGVDEHVPIDSLAFGARVLDSYLRTAPPLREETT
jgi:acetylornithine deacetylase/succinyl-diaminopimelate desuccinylase-like protein